MITRSDFLELIELEGWYYVLTELDPEDLVDAGLGEALYEAQGAFKALLSVAPTDTEDDYGLEDDDYVRDLVDEFLE